MDIETSIMYKYNLKSHRVQHYQRHYQQTPRVKMASVRLTWLRQPIKSETWVEATFLYLWLWSLPTRSGNCGSWCERRPVADQRISVFAAFNWSRSYLHSTTACTIVTSIVHSKLDYCNSLYYNLPKSQITRLQHIQNSLARVVVKLLNPATSLLSYALFTGSK